ncbi:hypothetical protein GOB94_08360 [Granulicella sp. 5B5]|uniref:hypothetical protein n=1 Tax=Granulicella sp. 5B5 TaxID=1617967 RepID=UPI0015F364D8|nr:hypothetical protein [Granulicella sp. 5B5]QMV18689.1 hypothetical protein GOB94_08360 [Granulicella sp. 5B5]
MKLLLPCTLLALTLPLAAQQPPGVNEMLQGLVSQQATHTAFTFDRDMLAAADGLMNIPDNALNSITVENYRYHEPAFYIPENMAALNAAYNAAGYKHLVEQHVDARDAAMPRGTLADLWLHNNGTQIDSVVVLLRTPHQMSVIDVTGSLRPLDLVHLSGHFGIPKVDPGAVMVPAPPGK